MKQYVLFITPRKDLELVPFIDDLKQLMLKHDSLALLNELTDPLIIENKNNNNPGYS